MATRTFLARLAAVGVSLDIRDLAPRRPAKGIFLRLIKGAKSLYQLVVLMIGRHKPGALYVVVDHKGGLIYVGAFALAARLLGVPLFLHHHVYAYINHRSRLFSLVLRLCAKQTVHLALCCDMREKLRSRYEVKHEIIVAPNIVDIEEPKERKNRNENRITLGLLSNLNFKKGLREAIGVCVQLQETGANVELKLAGPITDGKARHYLERVMKNPDSGVVWLGPVYDREKAQFYAGLDWFLFPTRYKNEAQPLVILEALGHGVPVIANERGCIASMIRNGGGCLVPDPSEYITRATEFVLSMSAQYDREQRAQAARARYEALQADAASAILSIRSKLRTL